MDKFPNLIIHLICQYLDYKTLIQLRYTNKRLFNLITKTPKYKTWTQLCQTSKKYEILLKHVRKEFNSHPPITKMPLSHQIVFTTIIIVLSPIIIPTVVMACLLSGPLLLLDKSIMYIQKKRTIKKREQSFAKIKSIYLTALTHPDYFSFVQDLLSVYPILLQTMYLTPDRLDLHLCVIYNNKLTFDFLLDELINTSIILPTVTKNHLRDLKFYCTLHNKLEFTNTLTDFFYY